MKNKINHSSTQSQSYSNLISVEDDSSSIGDVDLYKLVVQIDSSDDDIEEIENISISSGSTVTEDSSISILDQEQDTTKISDEIQILNEMETGNSSDTSPQIQNRTRLWNPKEDNVLLQLVQNVGLHNIKKYQIKALKPFLPDRTFRSCKRRFDEHLDPSIDKSELTELEKKKIILQFKMHGNKWNLIKQSLKNRQIYKISRFCEITVSDIIETQQINQKTQILEQNEISRESQLQDFIQNINQMYPDENGYSWQLKGIESAQMLIDKAQLRKPKKIILNKRPNPENQKNLSDFDCEPQQKKQKCDQIIENSKSNWAQKLLKQISK